MKHLSLARIGKLSCISFILREIRNSQFFVDLVEFFILFKFFWLKIFFDHRDI